jgi:hypothetical protein
MNKSFLLTTIAIMITCTIITYYSPICPIIGILNIIISIYNESDETYEYVRKTYTSIVVIFLVMTSILILRIIISSILFVFPLSVFVSNKNCKGYE